MNELNKSNGAKLFSTKRLIEKMTAALWLSLGFLSLPATGTILSSSTGVIQGREPDILDVKLSIVTKNKLYEIVGDGNVLACYSPANFEVGAVVNGTDADGDGPIVAMTKDAQLKVTNKQNGAVLSAAQMLMPMGASHFTAVNNPIFTIQANVDITTTSGAPKDITMGEYKSVISINSVMPTVKRLSDGSIMSATALVTSANYREGEQFQVLANGIDTKDNDKVLFKSDPPGIQTPEIKITENGVFTLPVSLFDNKAPNGYGYGTSIYITCKDYEETQPVRMPRALYAYGV